MNDVTNLADTVVPKSDQLNADDMLTGPIVVTVMDVKRGSQDQPVWIVIDGGRQPYKPCKSMRRILIAAWGQNGKEWIGKSMQLYCDPSVKFGGVALGGIRISHMSHISQTLNIMLTQSRGRKAQYTVHPLHVEDHSAVIAEFTAMDQQARDAAWSRYTPQQQAAINHHFSQQ